MKYFRFQDGDGNYLMVEIEPGKLVDLTSNWDTIHEFEDVLRLSHKEGKTVDDFVEAHLLDQDIEVLTINEIGKKGLQLIRPLTSKEIWAAGVTYRISRDERQRESSLPEPYERVYRAQRPEIFFKSTPERCVGPAQAVGIRADSDWNVPEPELAVVLYKGSIVGYTVGNDVSSRSIEGDNPLYLPQAKIYNRCCSIGPCIASAESIQDPHNLQIYCQIIRAGSSVFAGETNTSEMVRTCHELVSFLMKHNDIPDVTILFTGTGIVPPEEITLLEGDLVRITIDKIGTLENSVVQV